MGRLFTNNPFVKTRKIVFPYSFIMNAASIYLVSNIHVRILAKYFYHRGNFRHQRFRFLGTGIKYQRCVTCAPVFNAFLVATSCTSENMFGESNQSAGENIPTTPNRWGK